MDEYLEIYTFAGYVDSEEKIFDHTSDDIIFGSDGTTPYTPQQNNERLYAAYDPV